eukprot:TCONS_00063718-protein
MEWFRIYLVIFGVLCVCSNRVRSAEAKPVTKVKAFRIGVNRFWLHCFPRGKQAINGRKFEWFYNGTALKPNKRIKIRGSNTWVRIQKPTAQDVGKYSCKEILAGNDRKTLSIFHVKIDQSTLEFINKNRPKNKIVLSGDTTTLYCNATGTQPIKYKWYKNNKKIRRTSRPYLILKNLKTTDSAKYSCKAKNKVLNIRYDVNLDVKARARVSPYIEKDGDDDDGKAIVGSTASLSCYELQSPTLPKFVWLKWKGAANLTVLNRIAESSNNLVDYASMVEILPADRYKQVSKKAFRLRDPEHRIHGVDLIFPDVTLFDRGFYTCLVSNQAGYDYKITYFNIERSRKPRIPNNITDLAEKIGDDVEIKCFILGEGPLNVTWYKDDVPIGELQHISKFQQRNHRSIFKVSNFKSADAGYYKCRAKNAFGEASYTFKLVPMVTNNNAVPKIIKDSKTTYQVGIGEDLEIKIQYVVKGIAHTQLLLYCGGQTDNPLCAGGRKTLSGTFRVLDVPRTMVSEGDNHTVMLSFKKINESLYGNYSVFVGNALGYDFINVTIKPAAVKPVILHMRTTTFITQLGVDFMFPECKVVIQSKSLAKITWKKSFSDIASSERHIVRQNKLMIKDVRNSDAGYYTCNARNSAGEDQVRLILKVWPLVINKTSPALITRLGRGTVEIFCSAYGNTRNMTGTIENAGYPVPNVVKTTKDNLFMVKVNVTDDGTFVCTIQSGKEKAQSATVVEQFH